MRILFVCMGNICRSPTAEGVMQALVAQAGLEHEIELDSAGTGAWHIGKPPDARATAAARGRGITLEGRARQVARSDLDEFDLVIAMDRRNAAELLALVDGEPRGALHLLRQFDPEAVADDDLDVPDPYYGGEQGFEDVLDIVDRSCRGLLAHIRASDR